MTTRTPIILFAGAAMAALAGCGGGDEGRAGLTADQERELDETARMLDERDTVATSPDDLALNEGEAEEPSPEPSPPPPPERR